MTTSNIYNLIGDITSPIVKTLLQPGLLDKTKEDLKHKHGGMTIQDVSRTHRFFKNKALYKPFVNAGRQYKKISGTNNKINSTLTTECQFVVGTDSDFIGDVVLHIKFPALGNPNADISTADRYQYTNYPGIAALQECRFVYNNKNVFTIKQFDILVYQEFLCNDLSGWLDCIGQSKPCDARVYNPDLQVYEVRQILNGYQTPKSYQPPLDIWIRFIFPFTDSTKNALPNFNVQNMLAKSFEITLSKLTNIIKKTNSSGVELPMNITDLVLSTCEVYVEYITTMPIISSIVKSAEKFQAPTRYVLSYSKITNLENGDFNLGRVKYPIENIYFGFRPVENKDSFDNWFKFCTVIPKKEKVIMLLNNPLGPPFMVNRDLEYNASANVVEKIGVYVNNIPFYEMADSTFYSNYLPYKFTDIGQYSRCPITGLMGCSFSFADNQDEIYGFLTDVTSNNLRIIWEKMDVSTPVELTVSLSTINLITMVKGEVFYEYI